MPAVSKTASKAMQAAASRKLAQGKWAANTAKEAFKHEKSLGAGTKEAAKAAKGTLDLLKEARVEDDIVRGVVKKAPSAVGKLVGPTSVMYELGKVKSGSPKQEAKLKTKAAAIPGSYENRKAVGASAAARRTTKRAIGKSQRDF